MKIIKFLASTLTAAFAIGAGIANAVPPTVSIISPANSATFAAPGKIVIDVTAADADGTISKVEFFNGAIKLGQDLTSPYRFTWNDVAIGTYTITAKATDNSGAITTSSAITVKVNPNVAPTVSISAPANNTSYVALATFTISATAADTDGTIAKVDFYNGTTLLGTDTTSPYSFAWSNVGVGTYSVTAKATDDKGGVITSSSISVNVAANKVPTVSISAPVNNAAFVAPASIAIAATASDADGIIAKVEFYNGTILLGSDTTSPYAYTWASIAAGTYSITAKATDDKGGVTISSPVSVTVAANQAPVVSITLPTANANFAAPASITINANATDADGTISKVEFYNGTTLLGSDTTSPYSYTWGSVAAGTYSFTAKATDSKGAVTTSSAVSVSVVNNQAPTVTVTAPVNNDIFTAPAAINITASAVDANGTISKVEFFKGTALLGTATTSPFSFSWTNVAVGTYAITAKATDNLGATTTSSVVNVTVNANQVPTVNLTAPASNAVFTAPATINLAANAADANGVIAKVEFFNGTTLIGTATTSPYNYSWANVGIGTYSVKAKATDNNGAVTMSAAISIKVVTNQAPIIDFNEPVVDPSIPLVGPIDIKLGAIVSDPDGSVTKVEYFYEYVGFASKYKIGEAFIAPYRVVWKNAFGSTGSIVSPDTPIQYKLSAVAIDNGGVKTTAVKLFSLTTNLDLATIAFQMQAWILLKRAFTRQRKD